jgi:hypothetical protein
VGDEERGGGKRKSKMKITIKKMIKSRRKITSRTGPSYSLSSFALLR